MGRKLQREGSALEHLERDRSHKTAKSLLFLIRNIGERKAGYDRSQEVEISMVQTMGILTNFPPG